MFDIYIHNRFLKTPQGNPIQVPTLALAKAIEEEWEKDPSPHYSRKPLTSLVATALDRVADAQDAYINYIIQSVASDALLFWSPTPESLVKLQQEKWGPVIEEVNKLLRISLKSTFTFSLDHLSLEEEEKIKEFLNHQTIYKIAGLVHLITLTSSFCIAFLVLNGLISPEKAWDLAHLHEKSQRRVWGEDKEAISREKNQRQDFLETVRFLKLVV